MTSNQADTRLLRLHSNYPGVIGVKTFPANGGSHGVRVHDHRGTESVPAAVTANDKGTPTDYSSASTFDTDYAA